MSKDNLFLITIITALVGAMIISIIVHSTRRTTDLQAQLDLLRKPTILHDTSNLCEIQCMQVWTGANFKDMKHRLCAAPKPTPPLHSLK